MITSTITVLADIGPSSATAPPGSDRWQLLMNIGLWIGVAILAMIGIAAGVKFAAAYASGEASRERMMILGGVCVGAVFAGTVTALVNTLVLGGAS